MESLYRHRESLDSAFHSLPSSDKRFPVFQFSPHEEIGRIESTYRYVRVALGNHRSREFLSAGRRGQRSPIHSMGLGFARRTSASCPRLGLFVHPQTLPSSRNSATPYLAPSTCCMAASLLRPRIRATSMRRPKGVFRHTVICQS
ncbi:hypothetical protein M404DRAFT_253402 [Pisolithus tinctorius Marx 270]|uniref:Uncharacterized protein n=1 Tax=Pisolithus tinctorius Marx 270 TaxID=870435 RepID=A0A0C3NKK8_PISTI|nr:hypothetical protein M404DRAFT_253402 [Pisolithus tinctorius Marx 270]